MSEIFDLNQTLNIIINVYIIGVIISAPYYFKSFLNFYEDSPTSFAVVVGVVFSLFWFVMLPIVFANMEHRLNRLCSKSTNKK